MLKSRPLLSYILIAYGWTWLAVLPVLLERRGFVSLGLPHQFEAVGAFGPFVAAFVVMRATGAGREFLARLTRWRLGGGWWAFTLLTPLVFLGAALFIGAWRGDGAPLWGGLSTSAAASMAGFMDLLIVGSLLQSLGEEPGWRGYMVPKLRERRGPLVTSLLVFPVWVLWHMPFFLARPEFGVAQFVGFSSGILAASMWMTLLWDGTRSTLAAVTWHTLLNLTRNISLAVSMAAFLAYGMVVMAGAVAIVAWWVLRPLLAGKGGAQLATPRVE